MIFRNSEEPHCLARFGRSLQFVALVIVLSFAAPVGPCRAAAAPQPVTPDTETTAEGIGLQAASVLTSVLYLPFKCALAVAGGLAGGVAYAFSLGDMDIAEGVWGPSVYGTYMITPEHLTGEKPVEFFGTPPSTKR